MEDPLLLHLLHKYNLMNQDDMDLRKNVAKIAESLIAHGADITATTASGDTALHYLASYGFCHLAITCPVDLFEAENRNGWTCLHFAAESGQYKMIQLMLDKVPSLRRRKTNDHLTPGDLARRHFPRCTMLLEMEESEKKPTKSVRFPSGVKARVKLKCGETVPVRVI